MSNAISKPNKRNRSKTNDASDKRNETETESKVQLFSLAGSVVKDHNLTQDRLKIDPDLEKLIPRPSVEEFQALSISIERDGQLQDIIVDDQGTVVDGHSRFRILKDLGRPIKFEVRSFLTKEAECVFIIKSSLLRRNINDFQKIVLAQPLIAIEKVSALERQRAGIRQATFGSNEGKVGEVNAIIAREIGVSETTLFRGNYILAHTNPMSELRSDLEKGSREINQVYELLKSQERSAEKNVSSASEEKVSAPNEKSEHEEGSMKASEKDNEREENEESIENFKRCTSCHRAFGNTRIRRIELCQECILELEEFRRFLKAVIKKAKSTNESKLEVLKRALDRTISELS